MINTFVHLMIQNKKKCLDCQTLPEKYFGLPEFSTRRYQILQMGGRLPPCPPVSYAYATCYKPSRLSAYVYMS